MPTYEHICNDDTCQHEWEDFYSMTASPPDTCPKCQGKNVSRIVSGGSGRGIVEMSPSEFKATLGSQVGAMKRRAAKDENYRANLIGEKRYSDLTSTKN